MKKVLFFAMALVAGALAFTSCEKNNPNDPKDPTDQIPASEYNGIYVCDSIFDNGERYPGNVMFEIINSEQIVFHMHDTAKWEKVDDHNILITFRDSTIIEFEILTAELERNTISFYVAQTTSWYVGADWELYMYRLPEKQGDPIAITEANLIGKWRYGYEENKVWQDGKCIDVTRFNHTGLEILDLQAGGKMVIINPPYTYDNTWQLMGENIKLRSNDPYAIKEFYSNFMHIVHFNADGTSSNEQYYWRLD